MNIKHLLLGFGLSLATAAASAGAIAVERSGETDARPLVFVPGLASSPALWRPWAKRFESNHDVHVVGVAGFAGLPVAGPVKISTLSDALADYLATQELNDVVIVGHSLGGMIAMQTAAQSERVGDLILVDSVPFTAALFIPGATPESVAAMADGMRTMMKSTPVEAFREQQRAGLSSYTKSPEFLPTLIEWSDSSDRDAVIDAYVDLLSIDFRDALADVSADINVIAAWDASMGLPLETVKGVFENQYKAHAKASITLIEDSLHFVMIDQPDAFANVLYTVMGE